MSKHPFHWDLYTALSNRLDAIANSNDPRISYETKVYIMQASHSLWCAWDVQAQQEQKAADQARQQEIARHGETAHP